MPTTVFYDQLDAVIEQARLQGAAACIPGVVRRPWNIPPHPTVPAVVDIEDPLFAREVCDRTALNEMAITAYRTGGEPNSGRMGTVMAAKKAIDYQAGYERAFIARHASAVRRRAWAMARRTGHGSPTYGVFGVIRAELDMLISEATAQDNTPRNDSAATDALIGLG